MAAENSLPLDHQTVLAYKGRAFYRILTKVPYTATGVAGSFHRRAGALKGDLLHIHFATDAVMALPLIDTLKLPTIVTLHGYDVTVNDETRRKQLTGKLYLRGRSALFKKADVFLCVSEFIRRRALEAGFPEDKLKVHYIGIDRKTFAPMQVEREPLVVFVGRLVEKKGCSYLMRSMKEVQRQIPGARLVVIGYGPLHESLLALSRELGIAVEFAGRQSASEVREWLARARVLCVPSVTAETGDSEGLPTVIMEANAMGLPVAGFQHAGIPEIVKHGQTGLLYPEEDVDSLASGLIRLLKDHIFWGSLSRAAMDQVALHFDLSAQTAKLEGIYRQLVASSTIPEIVGTRND